MGAVDAKSSSTVTIHAQIKPSVAVSAPDDALSWSIRPKSPGIYTKTEKLNIKSNAEWKLTVRENDSHSKGFMIEWTKDGYGAKKLSKPMKIIADKEIVLPSDQPILSGNQTDNNGIDIQLTFMQEVTADDLPLKDGAVYRTAIAYVGSPKL